MGCTATQAPGGGGEDAADEPTASDEVAGPADNTKVRVRFVNATAEVVETEFYAMNEAAETIPEGLFQPANLVTVGIGVAGRGLLVPFTADSIELACTENLLLGTTGGRFQDPDLGTDLGAGTRRWLEEGAVFDCGATITFMYKTEGDGFTVEVSHESE